MSTETYANALPPTVPIETDHLRDRWDERVDADVTPATAWHDGYDVTPRLRTYLPPSEGFHELDQRARYYPPADALLVCRGYKLATVLHVGECASPALRQAIRLAFDHGER